MKILVIGFALFFHFCSVFCSDDRIQMTDQRLGCGSFGAVFLGKSSDGRKYAIKRLEIKEEFENEVHIFHLIKNHKFLVQYVMSCEVSGFFYIVMDYVKIDLFRWISLQESEISSLKVRVYLKQLASALDYLSGFNVIHTDLKPANILLDEKNDILKLCDYNLSVVGSFSSEGCDTTTRWYRSPEAALYSNHLTSKIDIWSLGCIGLELLSKSPVFSVGASKDNVILLSAIFYFWGIENREFLEKMQEISSQEFYPIVDSFSDHLGLDRVKFLLLQRGIDFFSYRSLEASDTLNYFLFRMLQINPEERVSAKELSELIKS